ncbi:LacI family DNA-binding transcriptional regulator [Microbacterium esteraromaticum]|nr:LacI family DNA-binding transcriptional regulator [Microbacterium esteraromaticum]
MIGSNSIRRPATVADVARRAGVGKSTASRALGGYGAVSEEVRNRVLSAAEELDYRPNELARSMNTGRSHSIGVIVGDVENPYFSVALRGISDTARAAGYDVILANTSERLTEERDAVRFFLDKRVDAVIVALASNYDTEHLHAVLDASRPLVLLDRQADELGAVGVRVRIAPAAAQATEMLVNLGHQRIAFISALKTDGDRFSGVETAVSSVSDRLSGLIGALQANGIAIDPDLIRYLAIGETETGAIIDEMLRMADPPTAMLASDATVALNVLIALRARGLRVPQDISVIAFDDSPWARISDPPLTGITHPIYDVGVATAKAALRLIEGLAAPSQEFDAVLTIRESHGEVRASTG